MGQIKSKGSWDYMYLIQFPYKIDGKQYFYAQSVYAEAWFTQELPGGQMGREIDHGNWHRFYDVQFPFRIHDKQFFYGQDFVEKVWFIQELLPNGKMGPETSVGSWSNWYPVQFPYSIGDKQFFYGKTRFDWSSTSKAWFIRQLLPDGKMGTEWNAGEWGRYYGVQFPYTVDGKQYFYGQNYPTKIWFTQELLADGRMGKEMDSGKWNFFYEMNFPFALGRKQYFFRRHESDWVIQELLPGGKMGQVTDSENWYQAQPWSAIPLQNNSSDPIENLSFFAHNEDERQTSNKFI